MATCHLLDGQLDQGLAAGYQSAEILADVTSARAHGYLASINTALTPWRNESDVQQFLHHVNELRTARQHTPALWPALCSNGRPPDPKR